MPLVTSINVGLPCTVSWDGKSVTTGIFKSPVDGAVVVRRHSLDGDGQADLAVHGGPEKAVYAYPLRHYDYWRRQLGNGDLRWGTFGENLTVDGLDEEAVSIGDEFQIGSVLLVVTQPRMPCFKLGIRFGQPDMVERFLRSQRTGFYFAVLEEGRMQAGDPVERVAEHPSELRVAEVTRLHTTEKTNEALIEKAISVEALPQNWRDRFERQLKSLRK